jgi:uncharacterized glyoxalase superfamily protein PhnB
MDMQLRGVAPYLPCEDAAALGAWYERAFGWKEAGRWTEKGKVTNFHLQIDDTELWLDARGAGYWEKLGRRPELWLGVWADPDAMYERVNAAGIEADPPEDKPYGVRMFSIKDPEGYSWGFMEKIPETMARNQD